MSDFALRCVHESQVEILVYILLLTIKSLINDFSKGHLQIRKVLPFMGLQDIFTYQELEFSYCPKLALILLGVQSKTDLSCVESGQSNMLKCYCEFAMSLCIEA